VVLVIALALGALVTGIGGPAGASGPTVGPAREVGPAIDGARNHAATIGAAFDGTNQLVVWTRLQSGTGHSGDIMAARVAPDGTVLDPGGFVVAATSTDEEFGRVSFDGTNFVVAWQAGPFPATIRAARVSRAGVVLDAPALELGQGDGPEVASTSDGTSLVTWEATIDSGNSDAALARRLSSDGAVLDAAPGIVLEKLDAPANAVYPVGAASNGDGFLVLMRSCYDCPESPHSFVREVSADGHRGAGASLPHLSSSIASNGTDYLVAADVCVDEAGCDLGGDYDIATTRISSGLVVTAGPTAAEGAAIQEAPEVAFSGGHYLVAYRRQGATGTVDIRASLLSRDGSTVDVAGLIVAPDISHGPAYKAVSPGKGGRFLVTYHDQVADHMAVLGRTVSPK
jgi:hypothetical protein